MLVLFCFLATVTVTVVEAMAAVAVGNEDDIMMGVTMSVQVFALARLQEDAVVAALIVIFMAYSVHSYRAQNGGAGLEMMPAD